MAPGLFLLLLCLTLSAVDSASIHNLTCLYNYDKCISCEWSSDRADVCTIQAHKVNFNNLIHFSSYSSRCMLEPSGRPGRRSCSLLFKEMMKSFHVVSLNLSCTHMSHSLLTHISLSHHVKLNAPGEPVVNGSSVSWAPPHTSDLKTTLLEYELQWATQGPGAGCWSKFVQSYCEEDGRTELQTPPLVLGRRYSAQVRVRVQTEEGPSHWSNWGPSLSWESAVGDVEKLQGSDGAAPGAAALWTTGSVLVVFMVLVLIMFRTSRTHWVYVMKLVKGAPLPSPAPSVLKMNWKSPLFSSDSFLTFLQPVDIIASLELVPAVPRPPQSPVPDDKPVTSPTLCSHLSSFFNPMYSQLCPTTPLLPCSADSPYGPHPEPNADPHPDLQNHTGQVLCPELDVLLLLSMAQQCQAVPVVCEYERVEAVGSQGGRARLTSVDSGVGSGEEVSQDSLNAEDQVEGRGFRVQEDQVTVHPPKSVLLKATPERDCIM